MLTSKVTLRKPTAMFVVLFLALGAFAFADPPVVDETLFPLSRMDAHGVAPNSFFVGFQDQSLYETGFQVQYTKTPNDEVSWQDAGPYIPPRNAPQYQQFTGQFPSATYTPPSIPQASTDIWYWRARAMVTHGPAQVPPQADLVNGPWRVDPAIAGPMPPTAITALVSSTPQLSWVNDVNPDPMKVAIWIFRSDNKYTLGAGQPLVQLPPTATNYTDTSAPPSTTLYYQVVAVRQATFAFGGNANHIEQATSVGTPSPIIITTPSGGPTPTPTPTATGTATPTPTSSPTPDFDPPSNLTATLISSTQAKLDWQDNSTQESGFYIDFGPDSCACSGRITLASPNTTTYTQGGLPQDAIRYYRVRAYRVSDGAITDPSNLAWVGTPPTAPTNLRTGAPASSAPAVTNAYVDMQWNDTSATEDGFRVEYCGGSCGDSGTWFLAGTVGANTITFRDGTVTGGITRSYRVFATKGLATSPRSNILVVTTPPTPLIPPSNLVASMIPNEGRKLSLVWQNNDTGTQSYRIEYASTPMGPWGTLATGVGVTNYLDQFALNPGQQRCYRVRAFNSTVGASDPSNTSCAVTDGPQVPVDPTNLSGVAVSSSKINLSWTDNSGNETGFKLYRSTDGGNNYILRHTLQPLSGMGGTVTFQDVNLRASTPYTYRVSAFNLDGESGLSNAVTILTLGPPIPEWTNPSPADQRGQNNVSVYTCEISGTADATVGVDGVLVRVTDLATMVITDLPLISLQGTSNKALWKRRWNEPGAYDFKPGRYNVAAYAHMVVSGQDVYSQPAIINGWTIPADQAPCPVTHP